MQLLKCATIALAVALFIPNLAYSDTIIVPDDYPTIQGAIDAAVNGDTVIVKPGIYVENIDFLGKAVKVASEQGPELTFIDGNKTNSVVTFNSGEKPQSVIDGYTIQNGMANEGGGIYCGTSPPTITHNRIIDNDAEDGGGVICFENSNPIIAGNVISGNVAVQYGGGIWVHRNSCPKIENNWIMGNTAALIGGYGQGGGIACWGSCPIISNNVIVNNTAVINQPGVAEVGGGGIALDHWSNAVVFNNTIDGNYTVYGHGGGIFVDYNASPIIKNNIITNSPDGEGIWVSSVSAFPTIDYNDFWNNGDGNYGGTALPGMYDISADPLFVDPSILDFHMTWPSPCRDAGDNAAVIASEDFEGDPRIAYGTVDMGADEFHRHLYYTGDAGPGGYMRLKIAGAPGTAPVIVWAGSSILEPPLPTPYGPWHLQLPFLGPIDFGSMPPSGITDWPHRFDSNVPTPLDIPMQALIGLNPDSLSNVCLVEVR